jgi:hypothetical protein
VGLSVASRSSVSFCLRSTQIFVNYNIIALEDIVLLTSTISLTWLQLVTIYFNEAKTSSAIAIVLSISASVCAMLMKPASYMEGAK